MMYIYVIIAASKTNIKKKQNKTTIEGGKHDFVSRFYTYGNLCA